MTPYTELLFASPWVLSAIPVLLILLSYTLIQQRRSISRRDLLSAAVRFVVLALVATSLAGPYVQQSKPAQELYAYLDVSASISPGQGEELLTKALDIAEALSVPLRVIPFAKKASPIEVPTSRGASYSKIRQGWQSLDLGGTNLEEALASSRATRPHSLALLLSDGYETIGSVKQSLSSSQQTAIFPITSSGEEGETTLSISQLYAPKTVLAQQSADVRLTVTNSSRSSEGAKPIDARVEIRHGDSTILNTTARVPPGEDISLMAKSDSALEGLHAIQAKLSWSDTSGAHVVNKTIWLAGERRAKVLLISGSQEDDRFLSRILTNQTYQLRSFIAPVGDSAFGSLRDYRAVVLNNVAAAKLPSELAASLRKHLSEGRGLVVIGGNSSFGLGGYIGTTLEDLLPVRLVPPRQEKKRLSVAVQLVIDKSRSMATDNRLEFAKASAEEVVRTLFDDDYIGIIGFDEVPFIALPLSKLSSVRSTALGRISRLFPTSRTNLFPALDEARRGLTAIEAGRKHIIVLTDGKLPDPGPYYFDLVKQARFLGITLSTIMVGTEADDGFLAQLAQMGGGAFYQTADPRNLPRVFLSDVKVASGERSLKEEQQFNVRPGPDPIVSTSITSFPILRGFVETKERDSADTELTVKDNEGTYPLLASWRVGKGRSVAFTSDANGRWSSEWFRWDRIQEFWSDLVESAQRQEGAKKSSNIEFDFRSWVEGSDVVMDFSVFDESATKMPHGEVETPLGQRAAIDFISVTPGHYQARLPNATAGTYRADLRVGDDELPPVAWDLAGELFGERAHRNPNMPLLAEIASESGGALDPNPEALRALLRSEVAQSTYSHTLLVVALCLFLLELVLRVMRGRRRLRASS